MKSTQEILNSIRLDEAGNPIAVLESSQQALNAVFDSEKPTGIGIQPETKG